MISLILFFLILSTGSVFATSYFGKRYEETIPLTIFTFVELIFLIGLTDHLRLGVYLVCAVSVAFYVLSIFRLKKNKQWKEFCAQTFTPAFFLFLLLLVLYAFLIVGRVAWRGDEFSFWATSVKQMWYIDAFHCTLPTAAFAEYPPGMQIFEFILQVLYGSFSEWRLMFAYMAFVIACAMPFLKGLSWKQPVKIIAMGAVILFAGTILYPSALDNLMVDFALSCTFAYAMATILHPAGKESSTDLWKFINVVMASNMMILIKQAGKLFAAVAIITFICCTLWKYKGSILQKVRNWPLHTVTCVALALIPVATSVLWTMKYRVSPAPIAFNTANYDWYEFLMILLRKIDGGYRTEILANFANYIVNEKITVGFLEITYSQLYLIMTGLIVCVYRIYRKVNLQLSKLGAGFLFGFVSIYMLGLLASYMYTFGEGEGVALASIDRYLNIYFSALLFVVLYLLCSLLSRLEFRQSNVLLFSLGLLCFTSQIDVLSTLTRQSVIYSMDQRAPFQAMYDQIQMDSHKMDDEDTILLINRNGYPHIPLNHMAYLVYPEYTVPWECSYGDQPLFEGDYYTQIMDAQTFHQHVYDLAADYIAINYVDQNFIDLYSHLFDHPLENGQVYRVQAPEALFELITIQ